MKIAPNYQYHTVKRKTFKNLGMQCFNIMGRRLLLNMIEEINCEQVIHNIIPKAVDLSRNHWPLNTVGSCHSFHNQSEIVDNGSISSQKYS